MLQRKQQEADEALRAAQREAQRSQDLQARLQRDLQEKSAQNQDQEERIATLEKRYLNAQRESTSLHDLNERLEQELRNKDAQLKVKKELRNVKERIESDHFVWKLATRRSYSHHRGEIGIG